MAWKPDDPDVMAEVLASELGADTGLLAELEEAALELDIAEPVAEWRARGGKGVEITGRGELGRLDRELGRGATDDDREVVRRAGGGAEGLHLVEHPRDERRLVQERLGLLVEEALVGAATTLGHEQELVAVTVDRGHLDLGRQVRPGVALLVHGDRRELAVAQVAGDVGVLDAARDRALVTTSGEHPLALLGLHDGGAGVLAHGQHTSGRDRRVAEQVEGDEPVVVAGLGVVEDGAELREVPAAEVVGDLPHGLSGQQSDGLRIDPQEATLGGLDGGDALGRDQSVLGGVLAEGEELGELEVIGGHIPTLCRGIGRRRPLRWPRRAGRATRSCRGPAPSPAPWTRGAGRSPDGRGRDRP